MVLAHFADLMLGIELDAQLGDEVELRLEEVDVVPLVRHQFRTSGSDQGTNIT